MTLLACCLYLLLIVLLGPHPALGHPSLKPDDDRSIDWAWPGRRCGNHGFAAVLGFADRVRTLAESVGHHWRHDTGQFAGYEKKPPAGADKNPDNRLGER